MKIITKTIYRTLGVDYTTEQEALDAEQDYISKNCNMKIGDVVYLINAQDCSLVKSRVTGITISSFDDNIYIKVEGCDGSYEKSKVFLDLNMLIHDFRNNMISYVD